MGLCHQTKFGHIRLDVCLGCTSLINKCLNKRRAWPHLFLIEKMNLLIPCHIIVMFSITWYGFKIHRSPWSPWESVYICYLFFTTYLFTLFTAWRRRFYLLYSSIKGVRDYVDAASPWYGLDLLRAVFDPVIIGWYYRLIEVVFSFLRFKIFIFFMNRVVLWMFFPCSNSMTTSCWCWRRKKPGMIVLLKSYGGLSYVSLSPIMM